MFPSNGTGAKSDWLLKGIIKEMPSKECQSKYRPLNVSGLSRSVVSSQICAHDDKDEKTTDTCPGDSGSPLQIELNDKIHIVGLTSFGMGCGSRFPSIYTRV
jgi:secreted trypsin-like serine protease